VVLHRDDLNAIKSFRNLTGVQIIEVAELNAYDVLCSDVIVFTQATLPTSLGGKSKRAAQAADDASEQQS
jgi:large subunit ribosomal protein L4